MVQVLVPTVKEEIVHVPDHEVTVHVSKTTQQECATDHCVERTVKVAVPKVQQQAAMVLVLVPTVKEEIVHVDFQGETVHVPKISQQEFATQQRPRPRKWTPQTSSTRTWPSSRAVWALLSWSSLGWAWG